VILSHFKRLVATSVKVLCARFVDWTKTLTSSLLFGTLADLARSKAELVTENALLRVPLIILKRQVKLLACRLIASSSYSKSQRFGPGSKGFSLSSQKPS
jgi:hypothetical protein